MLLSGLSADAPPQGNEGSARAGQGRMLGLADWMESEHYGMKQLAAHPLLLHPAPPPPDPALWAGDWFTLACLHSEVRPPQTPLPNFFFSSPS